MNIKISGSGTSIVFLHGYCETHAIWKDYAEALSEHYEIALVDLPGHGSSPLTIEDFSIDDIADLVHEELSMNGIDEYFVIGHSLGGYVALSLADNYADSILGFGLFSSSTYADDEEKKKVRDKVKEYILDHGVESFMNSFVDGLFAPENRQRLANEIEEIKQAACKTPAKSVIGYAMAMKHRPDRTSILATSDTPVFVIAGERDMAVRLETSQQMIDLIPQGDSIILPKAGHNGFLENKIESIDFIKSFINQYL
ncbi:alpha/beta fold hydrolase [Reichenbachiella sp. MSK19-1]|uniref:alpha/beta fold hydrolase n=1 Tax=Reichenbachiella sp. MSK19-1 TaxID=1897631 RepID=UPI000E6C452C|nr:alpha/beta fold hydrolase [Reichenbachiella sp. MSK19-1]RJE71688.1 hypothetical protein BGP76_06260 [Reichenbachiella sp. MSK19-1]